MTLNDVITRLDAIATDRYPIITDSDIEALKIAMDIVKEKEKEQILPPNIEEALEYLSDYDEYSPYQEAINTVITYIKETK